ncbi:MAG: twin-arginine translocase subunit TatC [Burkholderiales bacterium]
MPESDSFMSHLIELRDRVMRALIAIGLVFLILAFWAKDIYQFVSAPILAQLPAGGKMIATEITSPFFIPFKVTFFAAFVIALPYVLYQIWAFVAPGLYSHEKKLIAPLIVVSTVLFLCGMAFAYFLVFPTVFEMMQKFTPEGVSWMPDIGTYLSFVLGMFFAFGITFEVPVVVFVLVRMGIVSVAKLKEIRPYVIVGAFIVAAVVTPPDVTSQLLLAIPLCVLYECGIFVSRWVDKPAAAEETPGRA